ncbi:hypothetical protein SEVCU128_0016 [Staphylococcus epidermidis VCU128]|nr:hypothetical protein SEVCU128_0016 [Staphylococcus epidermidis VCU128]
MIEQNKILKLLMVVSRMRFTIQNLLQSSAMKVVVMLL